jgi:hypothetical protein
LVKDRLFLNLWNGRYGTAVIYINLRDNSIHEVAFPEEAEITDDQITLTEMYVVHDAEYMYEIEYGSKKFVIKTDLTDAEYEAEAKLRAENIQKIERKAQEEDKHHRQIAKKDKKKDFCILNYLDGSGGGLQLRMSGLIGNVSVSFHCNYDIWDGKWDGAADLEFKMNDETTESWDGEITSVSEESGRMVVALEKGAKGELIGYLHGQMANATYEGTYYDPYGNETPFKFFDDFQYWGF